MSDLTPVRDEDAFDIGKVHTWLALDLAHQI